MVDGPEAVGAVDSVDDGCRTDAVVDSDTVDTVKIGRAGRYAVALGNGCCC